MKQIELDSLGSHLGHLPADPRVIVSGNFATPYTVLAELDSLSLEFDALAAASV